MRRDTPAREQLGLRNANTEREVTMEIGAESEAKNAPDVLAQG